MRINLDAAGGVTRAEGLMAALTTHLGRREARAVVERVSAQAITDKRQLQHVAADEPVIRQCLTIERIAQALDPANSAGTVGAFVDRVLRRWPRDRQQG
jgi:3-carboxy-cis,cis-muconate cycloisomerase